MYVHTHIWSDGLVLFCTFKFYLKRAISAEFAGDIYIYIYIYIFFFIYIILQNNPLRGHNKTPRPLIVISFGGKLITSGFIAQVTSGGRAKTISYKNLCASIQWVYHVSLAKRVNCCSIFAIITKGQPGKADTFYCGALNVKPGPLWSSGAYVTGQWDG